MKVVSWNVGSYYFLNYAVKHRMAYHGTPIKSIYFQPELNGEFVSSQLASFDPDVVFLQEISSLDEASAIPALGKYPHKALLPNVHHEHSTLVAAKKPFEQTTKNGFRQIVTEGVTLLPVHLNAHHATARLADAALIAKMTEGRQRVIVIGDTNLWSRGNHCFAPKDREAYNTLTQHLVDVTTSIGSTSLFGFAFDKAFLSPDIHIETVASPRVRSHFMDHYPLVVNFSIDSCTF